MTSSVGMMTFPTEWKVIKVMFKTTKQIIDIISYHIHEWIYDHPWIGLYMFYYVTRVLTAARIGIGLKHVGKAAKHYGIVVYPLVMSK